MRGTHILKIRDNRVAYELKIRRNLTIIRGDSATGKTTLLEMMDTYVRLGDESGIYMDCDVPVDVYLADDRRKDWRARLSETEGSIVFIEEMNPFVRTREFAEYVAGSASYFVFITRWNLKNLPYSVEEIYRLTERGKYPGTHQIYNSMEQYYSFETNEGIEENVPYQDNTDTVNHNYGKLQKVVTEDSGSGYEFFSRICNRENLICESAFGNSNIENQMRKNMDFPVLYIADGAAFGAFMDECVQFMRYYGGANCHLWLPESFEYLILQSGIIQKPDVADVVRNPAEYIDSEKYISWERFFTAYLIENTKNSEQKYSKTKLAEYYKSELIAKRIMGVMPRDVEKMLFGG